MSLVTTTGVCGIISVGPSVETSHIPKVYFHPAGLGWVAGVRAARSWAAGPVPGQGYGQAGCQGWAARTAPGTWARDSHTRHCPDIITTAYQILRVVILSQAIVIPLPCNCQPHHSNSQFSSVCFIFIVLYWVAFIGNLP